MIYTKTMLYLLWRGLRIYFLTLKTWRNPTLNPQYSKYKVTNGQLFLLGARNKNRMLNKYETVRPLSLIEQTQLGTTSTPVLLTYGKWMVKMNNYRQLYIRHKFIEKRRVYFLTFYFVVTPKLFLICCHYKSSEWF